MESGVKKQRFKRRKTNREGKSTGQTRNEVLTEAKQNVRGKIAGAKNVSHEVFKSTSTTGNINKS